MASDDHRGFCVLSHQQSPLLLALLVELDDLHQLALLHVQLVHLLHLGAVGGGELLLAEVRHDCSAKSISKHIHCCPHSVNQPGGWGNRIS